MVEIFDTLTEDKETGTLTCLKCKQCLTWLSVIHHDCTPQEDINF